MHYVLLCVTKCETLKPQLIIENKLQKYLTFDDDFQCDYIYAMFLANENPL